MWRKLNPLVYAVLVVVQFCTSFYATWWMLSAINR